MIVYFGSNGQLLEVIEEYTIQNSSGDAIASSFITNAGNINSNKIFALFEGETPLASQCAITYKMPNGEIFSNASFFGNALVDGSIKFDKSRDLKYLSYGKTYEFVQFNLPSALLSTGGAGVYQTNITLYPSSEEAKDYSQFSFKALGTPASLVVNEITDTQYSIIMASIASIEAYIENFVPYSGATGNVDLGGHRLDANNIRVSSNEHTIDLAIGADGKPYLSYDTGQKVFFLPIDGATGTLATQGWVNDQNFVPFEENGDVDIGERKLTAGQFYLEQQQVNALFDLGQDGTIRIYNYDDNGYEFIFEFPIDGEEEDTYHIATREWVNSALGDYLTLSDASSTYLTTSDASSTYLTISDASETYLPLTGGELSGSIMVKNPTQVFNYIGISHVYEGSTGGMYAYLSEMNVDLTNPSPMLMLVDSTARNRGVILDTLGFKVGLGNVLAEQHRLLLPRDETDSANKTLATREWVSSNTAVIYKHTIEVTSSTLGRETYMVLLSCSNTPYTSMSDIANDFDDGEIWGVRVYDLTLNCFCSVANFYGGNIYYTDTQGVNFIDGITGITDTIS